MAPEKVSLGVEKASTGIRYKKMVRGNRFVSKVYAEDSRINKREAWSDFKIWRDSLVTAPAPRDNLSLIRDALTVKASGLKDYAELTGNPSEVATLRKILKALPRADVEQLFGVSGILLNSDWVDDRISTVARIKKNTDHELTARSLADEFIGGYLRKAQTARGSYGGYGKAKAGINAFVAWYGEGRSLEQLNEKTVRDYAAHIEQQIVSGKWSQTTANGYQKAFQTFLTSLGEDYPDSIRLPNNLRSPRLRIHAEQKEPSVFSIDEVKLLLAHAVPRTKLFLLLMLNCAMYQGDLSDLVPSEVDWRLGRIIRPRSKKARQAAARGKDSPKKLNWLLWRETFRLLKEFGTQEGERVFSTENGGPLITPKETTRNDSVRSCYRRLVDKLQRKKLLPKTWNKTLKSFRKAGSNILEKSENKDHAAFYELYLDHGRVAKLNYLTSGDRVPAFDSAIVWLGQQLGVDEHIS